MQLRNDGSPLKCLLPGGIFLNVPLISVELVDEPDGRQKKKNSRGKLLKESVNRK